MPWTFDQKDMGWSVNRTYTVYEATVGFRNPLRAAMHPESIVGPSHRGQRARLSDGHGRIPRVHHWPFILWPDFCCGLSPCWQLRCAIPRSTRYTAHAKPRPVGFGYLKFDLSSEAYPEIKEAVLDSNRNVIVGNSGDPLRHIVGRNGQPVLPNEVSRADLLNSRNPYYWQASHLLLR
ncbi:hypothetical protein EV356DRAFT_262612 [Viridothelium virens]|uniref:Uncharacterized protein n=1 Tax=Viridothelium virens TaxID=1048519 RepID=A0A6A6HL07_VIRVR|nr:hypothetical protein EV356DRAFT_262612 [Viridothelium virens]